MKRLMNFITILTSLITFVITGAAYAQPGTARDVSHEDIELRRQQERLGRCIDYYSDNILSLDRQLQNNEGNRVKADTVLDEELKLVVAQGFTIKTYFEFISVYQPQELQITYKPLSSVQALDRQGLESRKQSLIDARALINELYKTQFGERYSYKNADFQALSKFMSDQREFSQNRPRVLEILNQATQTHLFCREGYLPISTTEIAQFTANSLKHPHAQITHPAGQAIGQKTAKTVGEKAIGQAGENTSHGAYTP